MGKFLDGPHRAHAGFKNRKPHGRLNAAQFLDNDQCFQVSQSLPTQPLREC